MIKKQINDKGQKAYQREDTEDRSLPYRNWLRTINSNGFFIDIDLIKWRMVDGLPKPVAITDITRCDSSTVSESYLNAITHRLFKRDKQGELLKTLGRYLDIPVYLVLFQKDIEWLYVYSFQKNIWKQFSASSWESYLRTL